MAASFENPKLPSGYLMTPRVPQGLASAVEGLTREVLRHRPEDIYVFAARHFENLLKHREECPDGEDEDRPNEYNNLQMLHDMSQALRFKTESEQPRTKRDLAEQSGWSLNSTAKLLKNHHQTKTENSRTKHKPPRILSRSTLPGTPMLAKDIKTELRKNRLISNEKREIEKTERTEYKEFSSSRKTTTTTTTKRKTLLEEKTRHVETRNQKTEEETSNRRSKRTNFINLDEDKFLETSKRKSSRASSMDKVKDYVVRNFASAKSLDELQSPKYVEKVQAVIDDTEPIIRRKIKQLKNDAIRKKRRGSKTFESDIETPPVNVLRRTRSAKDLRNEFTDYLGGVSLPAVRSPPLKNSKETHRADSNNLILPPITALESPKSPRKKSDLVLPILSPSGTSLSSGDLKYNDSIHDELVRLTDNNNEEIYNDSLNVSPRVEEHENSSTNIKDRLKEIEETEQRIDNMLSAQIVNNETCDIEIKLKEIEDTLMDVQESIGSNEKEERKVLENIIDLYVLTEGSSGEIPDTVTTVIIPDRTTPDSLPGEIFGEIIKPEILESSNNDIDFIRSVKSANYDIVINHTNLDEIKEEDDKELQEIYTSRKSFGLDNILEREEIDDSISEIIIPESSSDEVKETTITTDDPDLRVDNSLDGEESTENKTSESTNEVKETTITDRTSTTQSLDPNRPHVPELNLDSLQDITISSFKMTDDEEVRSDTATSRRGSVDLTSFSEHLATGERKDDLRELVIDIEEREDVSLEKVDGEGNFEFKMDVCSFVEDETIITKNEIEAKIEEEKGEFDAMKEIENQTNLKADECSSVKKHSNESLSIMEDESMTRDENEIEVNISKVKEENSEKERILETNESVTIVQNDTEINESNILNANEEISEELIISEPNQLSFVVEDEFVTKNDNEVEKNVNEERTGKATILETNESVTKDENEIVNVKDENLEDEHVSLSNFSEKATTVGIDESLPIVEDVIITNKEDRNLEKEIEKSHELDIKEENQLSSIMSDESIKISCSERKDEENSAQRTNLSTDECLSVEEGEFVTKDEISRVSNVVNKEEMESNIFDKKEEEKPTCGEIGYKDSLMEFVELEEESKIVLKQSNSTLGSPVEKSPIIIFQAENESLKEDSEKLQEQDHPIIDSKIKETNFQTPQPENSIIIINESEETDTDAEIFRELHRALTQEESKPLVFLPETDDESIEYENLKETNVDEDYEEDEDDLQLSRSVSQCTTRRMSSANVSKFIDQNREDDHEQSSTSNYVEKKTEYHVYVPEFNDKSNCSSSFNSAATKIQAGVRGFLTRRRLQSTQFRSSTLDSVSSIQESFVIDPPTHQLSPIEEVFQRLESKAEAEGEERTETINTTLRESKARQRLRREDAVRKATLSTENAFTENGLQHTGEFHDCIPLPLLDNFQGTSHNTEIIEENCQSSPVVQFQLDSSVAPFVDLLLMTNNDHPNDYCDFITSVEDEEHYQTKTNEYFKTIKDDNSKEPLALSMTPQTVVIEEITSLEGSLLNKKEGAKDSSDFDINLQGSLSLSLDEPISPDESKTSNLQVQEKYSIPPLDDSLNTLSFSVNIDDVLGFGDEDNSSNKPPTRTLLEVNLPLSGIKTLSQESQLSTERMESPVTMMQIVPKNSLDNADDSGDKITDEESLKENKIEEIKEQASPKETNNDSFQSQRDSM